MTITLTLTAEQEAWLAARVANGEFTSTEDAVSRMIDVGIADYAEFENEDLAWAKPYVDEALTEAESGEVVTLEKYNAHMDALIARLPS